MHGYGLMKRANRLILWERIYAIEMNKELRTDVLISEERERCGGDAEIDVQEAFLNTFLYHLSASPKHPRSSSDIPRIPLT